MLDVFGFKALPSAIPGLSSEGCTEGEERGSGDATWV